MYFYFTAIKFFFDRWYFTAIKLSANLSKKVNDKKKAEEELTELEYQTNEDMSHLRKVQSKKLGAKIVNLPKSNNFIVFVAEKKEES